MCDPPWDRCGLSSRGTGREGWAPGTRLHRPCYRAEGPAASWTRVWVDLQPACAGAAAAGPHAELLLDWLENRLSSAPATLTPPSGLRRDQHHWGLRPGTALGGTPFLSASTLAILAINTFKISPLPELQAHLWTPGDLLAYPSTQSTYCVRDRPAPTSSLLLWPSPQRGLLGYGFAHPDQPWLLPPQHPDPVPVSFLSLLPALGIRCSRT